jgi:uncharacterized RDD family membrane protein YckC
MDLQKANSWKRIAAWILDIMLLAVLAVGAGVGLSSVLGYDGYQQTVQSAYDKYAKEYGININMDQATIDAMSQEERESYEEALEAFDAALNADEEAVYAYNMLANLSLVITTLGILIAILVLEFIVPLLLKNGQTVGKKCFSIGVVRVDGVKITPVQLFLRTVMGKFAVETMIPVYVVLMLFWGSIGLFGIVALLLLVIGQVICIAVNPSRLAIHDRMSGTVVVDISSQKIFESTDDLIAYTKRIHAEQAKHQDY